MTWHLFDDYVKTFQSLSSTAAFSFAAIIVTHLEESTEGLQWNNLDKVLQSQSVSFSWLSYMILFDSFIYLVLGWYIRNLKPGQLLCRQLCVPISFMLMVAVMMCQAIL